MAPGDVEELQREWRSMVLQKLDQIQAEVSSIQRELGEMRGTYVLVASHEKQYGELADRVRYLESSRNKVIGAMAAVQLLIGVVIAIWSKLT